MHHLATTKREGKSVLAEFPDCPGCQTFAGPREDIRQEAAEALAGWLAGWLETALAHGEAPPKPRARAPRHAMAIPVPAPLAVRLLLRWERQEQQLSQADFGKRLGVSRQQVNRFESKGANPTIGSLQRIAESLGLELEIAFRPAC